MKYRLASLAFIASFSAVHADPVSYEIVSLGRVQTATTLKHYAYRFSHLTRRAFICTVEIRSNSEMTGECVALRSWTEKSQMSAGGNVQTSLSFPPVKSPPSNNPLDNAFWQIDTQNGRTQFCAPATPQVCVDVTPPI
jgi:hypothetical protein